jgi:primosomal protein N' (replication factor Y) (superfamily II helicase)
VAGPRIVRVVADVAAVRRGFDYSVPESMDEDVRVGTMVRVPLGGRRVAGWVVEDGAVPPGGVELRPLAGVRGFGPPPEVIELARWASWRWAGPLPGLLGTASPTVAVRSLPAPSARPPARSLTRPAAAAADDDADPETRALAAEALSTADPKAGPVVLRLPPGADPFPLLEAAADLVPGSGDAGVLVLVPSHRGATAVANRLRRAGKEVAELPVQWARARAGRCVAVGARAAAFAPLPGLAAVVVLDAHDEAYHEERAPTWAAWEVALERARRSGVPCVLVSPCPTLDVLDRGRLVAASRGLERRGWPALEVADRRGDDPRTGLFSPRLVELLRWGVAEPDRRILCVVNRTGRVRLLACAGCGEVVRCEKCDAAVELVDPPLLRCRRCGTERPVVCTGCGSTRMKALRPGVTRIREELEALVGVPVAAVWGAPTRGGSRAGEREGDDGESDAGARVVVGTEAVLHRTRNAAGVAFLDFDAELLAPRLRAGEEALALLARAARLVSRGAPRGTSGRAGGRLLVQTRVPEHPALQAAALADPARLAAPELEVRRALDLPPLSALARVSGAQADAYGEALAAAAPSGVEVRGPVDGAWSVRAPDHTTLCDLLAAVPRPAGRLRVEVDPVRA